MFSLLLKDLISDFIFVSILDHYLFIYFDCIGSCSLPFNLRFDKVNVSKITGLYVLNCTVKVSKSKLKYE